MKHAEIIKLQKFLQQKFGNRAMDVRPRGKLNDSVEVFIGEESIGLIHVDDEDGDSSYVFNMWILDIDLDEVTLPRSGTHPLQPLPHFAIDALPLGEQACVKGIDGCDAAIEVDETHAVRRRRGSCRLQAFGHERIGRQRVVPDGFSAKAAPTGQRFADEPNGSLFLLRRELVQVDTVEQSSTGPHSAARQQRYLHGYGRSFRAERQRHPQLDLRNKPGLAQIA